MIQNLVAMWIIVWLGATVIVVFWRSTIKYLIMFAAIAIIATLGFGVIVLWELAQHVAG